MKYSSIIIWMLGMGLIVFLCVLVSGWFPDKYMLLTDAVVMMIGWSLIVFVLGGVFATRDEFGQGMPGLGVKMFTVSTYVVLSLLCIVFGRVAEIPLKWQLFLQFVLLFLVVVGLLTSYAASGRMNYIAQESEERHAPVADLSMIAQQVVMASQLNRSLDATLQSDIRKLAERIGYITPSASANAQLQEGMLRSSVNRLMSLINSQAPTDQIAAEVETAKSLIAQRLRTY